MILIRETRKEDLPLVQSLWADGAVMAFVGFPEGLHESDEAMEKWYGRLEAARPSTNHYCIFEDGVYCGESFYQIDPKRDFYAALDIKLFPAARGRGIAATGLRYAIQAAFSQGVKAVWVDPNPRNTKALALYRRLGFQEQPVPLDLRDEAYEQVYLELTRERFYD